MRSLDVLIAWRMALAIARSISDPAGPENALAMRSDITSLGVRIGLGVFFRFATAMLRHDASP